MTDYYHPQQTAPYPTNGSSMPNQPPPPYYPNSNNASIPVQEQFTSEAFSDKSVRRAFIRKVYLILSLQLAITLGIVCVFTFVPVIRDGVRRYYWIYYLSYAVFLVTYIMLGCFVECRRRFPANIICLFVFTLALSYMAGTISAFHRIEAVLIALIMTILLCLAITLFAVQTRWDFTVCSGFILVASLCVFLVGLACLIVNFTLGTNRVLQAVYAGLVLLLFGFVSIDRLFLCHTHANLHSLIQFFPPHLSRQPK
ncbi:hypothetical protein EG68_10031 [Paragonimus skrjabini miyazakii]|uniref:Fas apoptotic inhibitory molecule 2 n=1 Tax=Paragonimus skrjabini miyazakii TaxID=59628 RepID=A0A8S9YEH4_9TREM|nr:hypothetical protein EG68_10031 [Paragonimus skrjabini miyazakii]